MSNTVCSLTKKIFRQINFIENNVTFTKFWRKNVCDTKKREQAQKFPWNQLFSNFLSKNVDLTEKMLKFPSKWSCFWRLFTLWNSISKTLLCWLSTLISERNCNFCTGFEITAFLLWMLWFHKKFFHHVVHNLYVKPILFSS